MDFKALLTPHNELEIFAEPANALEGELITSVLMPHGGWWQSPTYGNALAANPRQKYTADLPARLRQSLVDCTKWLIAIGKASRIDIDVQPTKPAGRINYKITAYKGAEAVVLERTYDVSGSTLGGATE